MFHDINRLYYLSFPAVLKSTEGLLRRCVISGERSTPIYLLTKTKDQQIFDRFWW